jgi:hypothetical protein
VVTKGELQGALDRVESARKQLEKAAYDALDPITRNRIEEVIERDLVEIERKLKYLRDVA